MTTPLRILYVDDDADIRTIVGLALSLDPAIEVRAAGSGKVVLLGFTGGYGNFTCVQHTSSMSTCYAHQSRYGTSMGASVQQGQVIGYVGTTGSSTGCHLHFETYEDGTPKDPRRWL